MPKFKKMIIALAIAIAAGMIVGILAIFLRMILGNGDGVDVIVSAFLISSLLAATYLIVSKRS